MSLDALLALYVRIAGNCKPWFCCVTIRGTGEASLASVRELLRGERFALSSAEVERLVQQLGVADDSDVVRYDEWAAAMISWKTVCASMSSQLLCIRMIYATAAMLLCTCSCAER